jgi:hypothetical protein
MFAAQLLLATQEMLATQHVLACTCSQYAHHAG